MCFFRILGPAYSDQAGMMERSCTKWLQAGALPGAPSCGGSEREWLPESAARTACSERCGWSFLPSMGTASLGSATASNLALADPCLSLDLPVVSPEHGFTFCPGMDVAQKAQQNCLVPVTAQSRAGDATPKEGPKAGGHSSWS